MYTKAKLLFILILCNVVSSCSPDYGKNTSIEGYWESVGYGKFLEIDTAAYQFFDVTRISCLPSDGGDISEVKHSMKVVHDTLVIKSGYSEYYYTRVNEFPNVCEQSTRDINDISYNFEVFADTYKNHYAYFELNKVNWDSLYAASKNKITANTSEADLYLIQQEMIEHLKDNHGTIEPSESVYKWIERLHNTNEEVDERRKYGDFEIAGLVADHFIKEDFTKDSWIVKWGKMESNVGYVQINAMMLFADLDLSEALVKENGFVSTYFDTFNALNYEAQIALEVAGISAIMDRVMEDLMATTCMIIDVRFNGGGQDEVGLEVLRRFNKNRKQVASKKARHNNGFTIKTPIYLEPSENPYLKPVYLLTSQQSASATDMMALGSMELKHIERIGSHTNGAISDALQKQLPNGWHFSLSNEVYTDINDVHYENVGIPVHIELNYPEDRQAFFRSVASDLESDKQNILTAVSKLQNDE
jgi:C-terminal processing protease CtpA/Prc